MNSHQKCEFARHYLPEVGKWLLEQFNNLLTSAPVCRTDKGFYDLKTAVDEKAELKILSEIRKHFPDDTIVSEETGTITGGNDTWFIDALDGTDNFIRGLPVFGITVGFLGGDGSMFGIIHYPILNILTYALSGMGVFINDTPLKVEQQSGNNIETLHIITGYQIKKEVEISIRDHFASKVKRMRSLWCPSVDMLLISRGQTDVIISIENEIYDQLPGLVIAKEAGCIIRTIDGNDYEFDRITPHLPLLVIARNEYLYQQVQQELQKIFL